MTWNARGASEDNGFRTIIRIKQASWQINKDDKSRVIYNLYYTRLCEWLVITLKTNNRHWFSKERITDNDDFSFISSFAKHDHQVCDVNKRFVYILNLDICKTWWTNWICTYKDIGGKTTWKESVWGRNNLGRNDLGWNDLGAKQLGANRLGGETICIRQDVSVTN